MNNNIIIIIINNNNNDDDDDDDDDDDYDTVDSSIWSFTGPWSHTEWGLSIKLQYRVQYGCCYKLAYWTVNRAITVVLYDEFEQ